MLNLKVPNTIFLLASLSGFAAAAGASECVPSKWGIDDEIGAANYVNPEQILMAANLVKKGQSTTITTGAVEGALSGTVERISLKIGRLDVLGTDPVDKTDARVVEVYILLDDSAAVSAYTNMQVEVEIHI